MFHINYKTTNKTFWQGRIDSESNFDAHFDLRPYTNGGSSGTMFRQIADICNQQELEYSYLCIGVQKHSNTIDLFKTADRLGAEYILAKDIVDTDNWNVLEKLDDFIKSQDNVTANLASVLIFSIVNSLCEINDLDL